MGGFDGGDESRDERLSARLLETGVLTPDQLERCISERDRRRTSGQSLSLAEILIANGFVTAPRLSEMLSDVGAHDFTNVALPPEAAAQSESERFGKFTRVQLLGSGGMGEVWKAWDNQLGRWVALKFLKGRDRADVARLLREAQTAGRLSHANIVAVHEVGSERGEHYIAMQFIEGQTLETYPRKDRKGLVRLIRDAARAVALAHREGVVHRDLKPSNLMVAVRPGAEPHVYVADFGLARSMSDPGQLSRTGMILGTPEYMSPEQAKGETVDERTDVWALGATLYELTTDRLPFAASNLVNLLKRIADEDPKRPRKIQPRISPDLETIILKCLEKDPSRRYGTADALADDLDRYVAGEPIQARPASVFYRLRKRLAKRKAVATATVAGLIAVGFLGVRLWQAQEKETSLKELSSLWLRLIEAKEELRSPLEADSPERVRKKLETVVAEVGRYIDAHPNLPQGYFVRARGRFYLDDRTGAERDLSTAVSFDPSFAPGFGFLGRLKVDECQRRELLLHKELKGWKVQKAALAPLLTEARVLLAKGRAGLRASIDQWGLPATREDEVAEILQRALVARFVDENEDAALKILEEANKAEPSEELMHCLGSLHPGWDDQVEWHRRAIARRPHFAVAYFGLGALLEDDPRFEAESKKAYEDAIRVNPRFAAAHVRLANICWGEFDKLWEGDALTQAAEMAAKYHQHLAAAIRAEPWNDEHYVDRAGFLDSSSQLFDQLGRPDDAAAALKDAARNIETALRLNDRNAEAHLQRARDRLDAGTWDSAIADCDRALSLVADGNPKWDPETYGWAHRLRGEALRSKGDHAGAADSFSKVMDYELDLPLRQPRDKFTTVDKKVLTSKEYARVRALSPARELFKECAALHMAGRFSPAVDGFGHIADALPETELGRNAAYNVGCGHALLGEKSKALEWLEKSVNLGYSNVSRLEKDDDLKSLRGEERYRKLVERLKSK